jgi:hypothetical protein
MRAWRSRSPVVSSSAFLLSIIDNCFRSSLKMRMVTSSISSGSISAGLSLRVLSGGRASALPAGMAGTSGMSASYC